MKVPLPQPTVEWTVDDVLRLRPDAVRVFIRHRMACVGCAMAPFETVAEAAREYRMDVSAFMRDLQIAPGAVRQAINTAGTSRRRAELTHHKPNADDLLGAREEAP